EVVDYRGNGGLAAQPVIQTRRRFLHLHPRTAVERRRHRYRRHDPGHCSHMCSPDSVSSRTLRKEGPSTYTERSLPWMRRLQLRGVWIDALDEPALVGDRTGRL